MFHPQGPTFFELAQQALSSTVEGYDRLAPKFEYTPFRTPDAVLEAVASLIGGPRSVDRALDICCGTGAGVRMLRPLARQEVVGVDLSEGMLAEAQRRLADAPRGVPTTLMRADALALPFRDAFDVATCFGAFGHIVPQDERLFVQNVARALSPGGRFVFVTADVPSWLDHRFWLAKAFNTTMWVSNQLVRPPFIMFYLTFLLPRARALLESEGFHVEVHSTICPAPFERAVGVVATLER